jgi:predicted metal-dependent phosphotriesterase family hydrolase/predicted ATPase
LAPATGPAESRPAESTAANLATGYTPGGGAPAYWAIAGNARIGRGGQSPVVTVPTSAGEVSVADLGVVLTHEHVFLRTEALQWGWPGFGGWDEDAQVAAARERLTQLARAGVGAIIDVTVPGMGRDPALVARAAEGTGVRVLFATGFHAAAGLPAALRSRGSDHAAADQATPDQATPDQAAPDQATPDQAGEALLESLFERDLTAGIGGTGIRAAVLAAETGAEGLTGDTERVTRAVAAVSARTGAVICTQANAASRRGLDQQRVFAEHGVDLSRVLIGHCSESADLEYLEALLAAGSWLGWDRLGQSMDVPLDTQLDTLAELCWRGHAGRIMLSHDQASFSDTPTAGGGGRALPGWQYASAHSGILTSLRDRGVPEDYIQQMLVRNPRDFLGRGLQAPAPPTPPLVTGQQVTLAPAGAAPAGTAPAGTAPPSARRPARGPAEPGPLTGRERELGDLRALAGQTRMIALCGAGGTGKTRLLRALLPALADDYPDGTFTVTLDDLRQSALVPARVAAILGVVPEPGVPVAETLTAALAGRRLVLGLDGCDHLAAACADLCARLLASTPGLLLVTASRKPLEVPAATPWPVPPLARPAVGDDDPAAAARSDAVRLFAERAAAAAPGFALDAASRPAVLAICRALGGLPLPIELAAARIAGRDAGQVAAGLADWLGALGLGRPGDAARPGATVSAAIGWSHDLLDPPEQVLLARLSVFAGWSLEMAERVCADERLPAARVHGLMAGLERAALVQRQPGQHGRYRLPGAVRDFAAARLTEAGERERLRRRLRDYVAHRVTYLTTIGKARVPLRWQAFSELFRHYQSDARNIRAVLAWCLEHGDTDTGLRICTELGICWMATGAHEEGGRWLDAFLDAAPAGPPAATAVRGPALAVRAQLAFFTGDRRAALAWAATGLEQCQAAGDTHYAVIALNAMAQVALSEGRPEDALHLAGEALNRSRPADDQWNEVYALNNQAAALAALGRLPQARECGETSLALSVETGQHWGAALARRLLGDAAREMGDLTAAREYYLALLPFARQAMTGPDAARCLGMLGRVALDAGDPAAARGYLAESLQLSLRSGDRAGAARCLLAGADLAVSESAPDRAVQLAAAATALCEAARLPPPPAADVQRHRDAAAGLGQDETARLWAAGLTLTGEAAAHLAFGPPAPRPSLNPVQ